MEILNKNVCYFYWLKKYYIKKIALYYISLSNQSSLYFSLSSDTKIKIYIFNYVF